MSTLFPEEGTPAGAPGSPAEFADRINGAIRSITLHHKTLAGQALEPTGLHVGQESVLQALAQKSPRTNAELAAWMGCEPPSVTSMVAKLEKAGLVARARRSEDARVIDVEITDEGRAALDDVSDAWLHLAEDTVGDLSDTEALALLTSLERLALRLRTRREESRRRRGHIPSLGHPTGPGRPS